MFQKYQTNGQSIEVEISVPTINVTDDYIGFWILDFDWYNAIDNPVVNDTVKKSLTSSCSTLEKDLTVEGLFSGSESNSNGGDHFFDKTGNDSDWTYSFSGNFGEVGDCSRRDNENVWLQQNTTEEEYHAIIYANYIRISLVDDVYKYFYYSKAFVIVWKNPRYYIAHLTLESGVQSSVSVKLMQSSVEPEYSNNEPTGNTQLSIEIKSIVDDGISDKTMLAYVNGSESFTGTGIETVTIDEDPSSSCFFTDDSANTVEENCEQIWRFTSTFLIAPEMEQVIGTLNFELAITRCTDSAMEVCTVDGSQPRENITLIFELDQVDSAADVSNRFNTLDVQVS